MSRLQMICATLGLFLSLPSVGSAVTPGPAIGRVRCAPAGLTRRASDQSWLPVLDGAEYGSDELLQSGETPAVLEIFPGVTLITLGPTRFRVAVHQEPSRPEGVLKVLLREGSLLVCTDGLSPLSVTEVGTIWGTAELKGPGAMAVRTKNSGEGKALGAQAMTVRGQVATFGAYDSREQRKRVKPGHQGSFVRREQNDLTPQAEPSEWFGALESPPCPTGACPGLSLVTPPERAPALLATPRPVGWLRFPEP